MEIRIEDLGKKYNRQWIFRHLNMTIANGQMIAITGHNGSGKSTLLKMISNYITPSEGEIRFNDFPAGEVQTSFSYVAPYQNLIEEFTLKEHLNFHANFKKPLYPTEEILDASGLSHAHSKLVKEFSSGMKQRLKLALAFFYESSIIFLDEPTSNLDQHGINWYLHLLSSIINKKTLIIASNDPNEYQEAHSIIEIEKYKP